jgi:hypothetical protein
MTMKFDIKDNFFNNAIHSCDSFSSCTSPNSSLLKTQPIQA